MRWRRRGTWATSIATSCATTWPLARPSRSRSRLSCSSSRRGRSRQLWEVEGKSRTGIWLGNSGGARHPGSTWGQPPALRLAWSRSGLSAGRPKRRPAQGQRTSILTGQVASTLRASRQRERSKQHRGQRQQQHWVNGGTRKMLWQQRGSGTLHASARRLALAAARGPSACAALIDVKTPLGLKPVRHSDM